MNEFPTDISNVSMGVSGIDYAQLGYWPNEEEKKHDTDSYGGKNYVENHSLHQGIESPQTGA
jgi:hypothetical protein